MRPKHDRHAKISSLADWLTGNCYNAGADAGYTERRLMVERVLLAYKAFNGDAPSARAFIIVYAKELFDWYPAMIEFVIAYVFGRHMRNASAGQVHQLVKEVFEEFVNPPYGIGEGVDFNTTRAGGGKREREENRDRTRCSYACQGDRTPRRGPRSENTNTPTNTLYNGRTRAELAYLFTHGICPRCLSQDAHNFQECKERETKETESGERGARVAGFRQEEASISAHAHTHTHTPSIATSLGFLPSESGVCFRSLICLVPARSVHLRGCLFSMA